MREDRGAVTGPIVVHEPYTLWGTCGGDVTVAEGGKFYMRGSIYGDLTVEYGGRVHIYGHITGNLKVARGSKVIVSGTVGGDAVNEGGRLFVDALGEVQGKVRTLKGETKVEPKAAPVVKEDPELARARELAEAALAKRSAELSADAEKLTVALKGKELVRVWQHRPEAMGIEFVDGTRLYVAQGEDGIEITATGRVG